MNTPDPKTQLQEWLQEWNLWQRLREELPPDPDLWNPGLDFSEEPAPRAGDIRLWPARGPADGPFYAVLLPGEYGRWRVIPFSPYATPATPEEWKVRDTPPLRVLQLWNRRVVTRQGAAASWKADTLGPDLLWVLNAALTALESGGAPPNSPQVISGPPLVHPLDPRHLYLDEEYERTDRAMGEFLALSEGMAPQALAAEPESGEWGEGGE